MSSPGLRREQPEGGLEDLDQHAVRRPRHARALPRVTQGYSARSNTRTCSHRPLPHTRLKHHQGSHHLGSACRGRFVLRAVRKGRSGLQGLAGSVFGSASHGLGEHALDLLLFQARGDVRGSGVVFANHAPVLPARRRSGGRGVRSGSEAMWRRAGWGVRESTGPVVSGRRGCHRVHHCVVVAKLAVEADDPGVGLKAPLIRPVLRQINLSDPQTLSDPARFWAAWTCAGRTRRPPARTHPHHSTHTPRRETHTHPCILRRDDFLVLLDHRLCTGPGGTAVRSSSRLRGQAHHSATARPAPSQPERGRHQDKHLLVGVRLLLVHLRGGVQVLRGLVPWGLRGPCVPAEAAEVSRQAPGRAPCAFRGGRAGDRATVGAGGQGE